MANPSPLFHFSVASSGQDGEYAAGASVIATLDSLDGVNQVEWSIVSTDELTVPGDYTLVASGSLGSVVTTTALTEGTAAALRCLINAGRDPRTGEVSPAMATTQVFWVATDNGLRVRALGEDASATDRDVRVTNAIARASGSGGGGGEPPAGSTTLTTLRAVTSSSRTARQPFFVDSENASFIWKPSDGAGIADDGVNVIRPTDVLIGSAGRFYRDPQVVTTATPGVLEGADKSRINNLVRAAKPGVRAASVGASLALSGALTLDGVALSTGDLVLVKDQAAPAANGVYRVNTAGTWSRWSEADAPEDFPAGYTVHVEEGSRNRGSEWVLVVAGAITLGSTALRFVRFDGFVDMRAAGCWDDGEFDNSAIVNTIVAASQNAATTSQSSLVLYFPSDHGRLSNYRFLSPIRLPRWDYFAAMHIRGDAQRAVQLTGPDAAPLIQYHTINVAEMTGTPGITFSGAGPGFIDRNDGLSFIDQGFKVGDPLRVDGSVSNDYAARTLTGVAASRLTVAEPLIAEGPTLDVSLTVPNQNGCTLHVADISLGSAPGQPVIHWDPLVSEEDDPNSLLMRLELQMHKVFCTRGPGTGGDSDLGLIYIRRGHRCRFHDVEAAGLFPQSVTMVKTGTPVAPTLTFANASGDGTITLTDGSTPLSFITMGFRVGQYATLSGTTSNNFAKKRIKGVASHVLTFEDTFVAEGPIAVAPVSLTSRAASSFLFDLHYTSGTIISGSRNVGIRGGIARMVSCGETILIGCRSEGAQLAPALEYDGAGQLTVINFTAEGTGESPAVIHCKNAIGLNFTTVGLATPDVAHTGNTFGDGLFLENCRDVVVDNPLHLNAFSNLGDGNARAIRTDENCRNVEIRGGSCNAESAYTDYDLQGTDVQATVGTASAGVTALGVRRADIISGSDGGTGAAGVEGKHLTLRSGKGANPATDANGNVRVDLLNLQAGRTAAFQVGHKVGDEFTADLDVSAVDDWSGERAVVEGEAVAFAGSKLALFARTADGSLRASVEQPSALTPALTGSFVTGDGGTNTILDNMRTRINELESKLSDIGALYQGVPKSIFGNTLIWDLNPHGYEDGELRNDGGTGPDFLQVDSGKRPALGSMNGRAALIFDGTDDFLQAAASWTGPTVSAIETFIVLQLDGDAPTINGNGLWRFGTEAGGFFEVTPYSDNHLYEGYGSTARKDAGTVSTPTMRQPCIYSVRSGPGVYSVHLNGVQLYSTASNTMAWQTQPLLGGSGNTTPTIFHKGKIARKVTATNVNTPKRNAIMAYLAEFYGITL